MGSTSGYGSSITAYLYSNGGTKNAKCALYDSSKNLVANSMTEQKSYSTGWNTFNFGTTKPFLTANAWYHIVVWSNDGSGQGHLYYATSGGSGVFSDTETYVSGSYTGFPSPFEGSTIDANGLASIYCTYIVAPIVTTNTTIGIEDTNATLNGYLQNDGGQASDCGLRYGTTSATYTQNFTKGTYTSNTPYSNNNGSLTSGDLYYVQAWAKNTAGFSTGSELKFFTKPPKTTNLLETTSTNTTLEYSWTKPSVGTGATAYTHIQYKIGSNPSTITDGTNTYNGTSTTDNTLNLEPGTHYYFSAFSWAIENGEGQWNDTYATINVWTNPGDPTIIALTSGNKWINITFIHGINGSHTLIHRNDTGNATYPKTRGDGILIANTTNQYVNDTGLTPGITYYYTLWTWDTDGQKWCDTNKTVTGTTVINPPFINSYNLFNNTGSKLNNATGLLDVNTEYYFTVNVTDLDGWEDINYINITSWYDNGDENTFYNQTIGGNLNMFLQYENISGTSNFKMQWPDDEATIILVNCSENIVNSTTRIINISFKPLNQVRWANSNDTWDTTQNVYNDPYSWNFNISVLDETGRSDWRIGEYGIYKFAYISPSQDWVDVYALPGFSDTSNIVSIVYSSNYNFDMSVFFEENLNNQTWTRTIPIANNVDILADADLNDDITTDQTFLGIGEINSIEIFNESGIFGINNVSQTVNVQFRVYVPIGTLGVKYTAHVATKIILD